MGSPDQRRWDSRQRATFSGLELRCPPLPGTLTDALELMQHPEEIEVANATEMVERDPIVVARLLNIVNSAYYGIRHRVTSAERAVVMLGPVAVAGIVVGMQILKLREVMDGRAGEAFNRLIRHSVAAAFITRHLVEGRPHERRALSRTGPAFTAGLLHDFGKIILVYNYPEKAVALYDDRALRRHIQAADQPEVEQLIFGFDHTEAGEYVARKLNLPDLLIDVARFHHDPGVETGNPETDRLIRAVAAADVAARTLGYAFTHGLTLEECTAHPIWQLLIERDLPDIPDPESLVSEVAGLQDDLDQSVGALTMPASQANRSMRR